VRTLRVGVNLLYLKPGRVGGTEVYVDRLLRALGSQAAEEVEPTLFVNRRFAQAYPDLSTSHPTVVAPISGDSPPARIAAESSWLAHETARRPLDLVHHVANTIPQVRSRPAVVTIHDLQPLVRPGDFGRVKGGYLRMRLRSAARATAVTTPSSYVRDLVIDRLGVDRSRVTVVPAPIVARPTSDDEGSRLPPGVSEPFFLYAAITHPHKNHLTLIRAFARVAPARPEVSLVLSGGPGAAEETVVGEVARLGLGDRVHRLGRIPRQELDVLFRHAVALAFPSHHEGYGLPLAEAMALGCPVIASDTTAFPEVVGDAGVLLDPRDVDGWAAALGHVLEDEVFRSALIAAGRKRVESLTPAETARRLVAAYRAAREAG
jgi:glycosyltransferase involved in cell wall biosynthesis